MIVKVKTKASNGPPKLLKDQSIAFVMMLAPTRCV